MSNFVFLLIMTAIMFVYGFIRYFATHYNSKPEAGLKIILIRSLIQGLIFAGIIFALGGLTMLFENRN